MLAILLDTLEVQKRLWKPLEGVQNHGSAPQAAGAGDSATEAGAVHGTKGSRQADPELGGRSRGQKPRDQGPENCGRGITEDREGCDSSVGEEGQQPPGPSSRGLDGDQQTKWNPHCDYSAAAQLTIKNQDHCQTVLRSCSIPRRSCTSKFGIVARISQTP